MNAKYTAGSFTKNFGWDDSYEKLHLAIRNGFSEGYPPIERESWRTRSKIADSDRELIPLNFFLHSMRGRNADFVVVDRLVERTVAPYNLNFANLALFAFHLASSGNWRHSKWPDGRVAGWANEFIRTVAWRSGSWDSAAFTRQSLKLFLQDRIEGEPVTRRKVLTNYRYMLTSAGALIDNRVQNLNFQAPWLTDAAMLFWDRQIFAGELHGKEPQKHFEAAFFRNEIYKLLGCGAEQGKAIAVSAYRAYSAELLPKRLEQLEKLRVQLAA